MTADDLAAARLPVTQAEALAFIDTPAYARLNQRRAELIHRKNRDGLPPDEAAEFADLQEESRRLIELAHPRPWLAGLESDIIAAAIATST